MSDENENLSNAETQLLLRVRLNMEEEFNSGRKKKKVLWKKVVNEVKNVNPNIRLDSTTAQRKFSNLLVTYRRIKKKNKSSGREATYWSYFEDFDEVYGTRHSITPPTANLQASLNFVLSTSPTSSSEINNESASTRTTSNNEPQQQQQPPDSPPTTSQRAGSTRTTSNNEPQQQQQPPDSPPTTSQRATRPRATSNKDILKFFEAEAVKEEARHNELMVLERDKLSLERERIKALLDMKTVLADYLKK